MALNSGRFSSPSLGVIVTANIQAFQQTISQIPSITKSALAQAAEHIRSFNAMLASSMSRIGQTVQNTFTSVGRAVSKMMEATRGYFARTKADDLGIPEFAGLMNPSKFMTHMAAIGSMASTAASKVTGFFTQSISTVTGMLRSSFSKAWDSVVSMSVPAASRIANQFQAAYTKTRSLFRRTPGDDLGIPELAGVMNPSKIVQGLSSIMASTRTAATNIRSSLSSAFRFVGDQFKTGLTTPIERFRVEAEKIQRTLPAVAEGYTRLFRGNRPGEVGKNTSFTNSLEGIALPFKQAYGGPLSYVDVATDKLKKYMNTVGVASGAEFNLTKKLAASAKIVPEIELTKFQKQLQSWTTMATSAFQKVKDYFTKRTPMDDLGIPEFAGRLEPTKFLQRLAPIIDMSKAAANKIGGFFTSAFDKVSASIPTSFSSAWDKVTSNIKSTASNIADFFRRRPGDDMGIPERLGITSEPSRFRELATKMVSSITGGIQAGGAKIRDAFRGIFALPADIAGPPQMFWNGFINGINKTAIKMKDFAATMAGGFGGFINNINTAAGAFNRGFGPTQFTQALGNANNFFNGLLGSIFNVRNALMAMSGFFLVRWGKNLASSFIDAGAEMQSFRLQIESIYKGSKVMVDDIMNRLIKFARETPFSTQETVRAFNILESAGIEATDATLNALGKLGFTFHRTLEDVARDFVSQRTQSLHTFGIDIQHSRDAVTVMMGDSVRVVKRSRNEVVKALTEIINETLPGLTEKALGTWKGLMEFFDSIWFEIRSKIGTAILDDLQPQMLAFGKQIEQMMLTGKFQAAAEAIGKSISKIAKIALDQGAKIVDWLSGVNPDKIESLFDRIIGTAETVFTKVKGYLAPVVTFMGQMISVFDALPPGVKEVGLISAFLFGPGTPLGLLAALTALQNFSVGGLLKGLTSGNWMNAVKTTAGGGAGPGFLERTFAPLEPKVTREEFVPKFPGSSEGEWRTVVKKAAEKVEKATEEVVVEEGLAAKAFRVFTTALGAYAGWLLGKTKGSLIGAGIGNQFGLEIGGIAASNTGGIAGTIAGSILGGRFGRFGKYLGAVAGGYAGGILDQERTPVGRVAGAISGVVTGGLAGSTYGGTPGAIIGSIMGAILGAFSPEEVKSGIAAAGGAIKSALSSIADWAGGLLGVFQKSTIKRDLEKLDDFTRNMLQTAAASLVSGDVWKNIGTAVAEFGKGIWDAIVGISTIFFNGVDKAILGAKDVVTSGFSNLTGWFGSLFSTVGGKFSDLFSGIGSLFSSIGERLGGNFGAVGKALSGAFDSITTGIAQLGKYLWDLVVGFFKAIGNWFISVIPAPAKALLSSAVDHFNKALEALSNAGKNISDISKSLETKTAEIKPPDIPKKVNDLLEAASKKYGVDPTLAKAIAFVESGYDQSKIGEAKEVGVMQLMPPTAKSADWYKKIVREDIDQNIDGGLHLLMELTKQFKGDIDKAIAAYNTGGPNVEKGIIPESTKRYVERVKAVQEAIRTGKPITVPAAVAGARPGRAVPGAETPAPPGFAVTTAEVESILNGTNANLDYMKSLEGIDREEKFLALAIETTRAKERIAQSERQKDQIAINTELKAHIQAVEKQISKEMEAIGVIGLYGAAYEKTKAQLEGAAAVEQVLLKLNLYGEEAMAKRIANLSDTDKALLKEAGVLDLFTQAINEEVKALESEKYVMSILLPFYNKLGEARAKVFQAETEFKLFEGVRNQLQDLNLAIQAQTAVTAEERAQANVEKIMVDLKRRGFQMTEEENKKLREQLGIYEKISEEVQEVLKHHQEYAEAIKGSILAMEDTLSTIFGRITDMFTTKGPKDWKAMFRNLIGDLKKSVDDMVAASLKALFNQGIKELTGKFPDEWAGKAGGAAATAVYGTPKVPEAVIASVQKTMDEILLKNKGVAEEMSKAMRDLDKAVGIFMNDFGKGTKAIQDAGNGLSNSAVKLDSAADHLMGVPVTPQGLSQGEALQPYDAEDLLPQEFPSIDTGSIESTLNASYGVIDEFSLKVDRLVNGIMDQSRTTNQALEAIRLGQAISPKTQIVYDKDLSAGTAGQYYESLSGGTIKMHGTEDLRILGHEYSHALEYATGVGISPRSQSRGPYAQYGHVSNEVIEGAADVISGTGSYLKTMSDAQRSQAVAIAEMVMAAAKEQEAANNAIKGYKPDFTEATTAVDNLNLSIAEKVNTISSRVSAPAGQPLQVQDYGESIFSGTSGLAEDTHEEQVEMYRRMIRTGGTPPIVSSPAYREAQSREQGGIFGGMESGIIAAGMGAMMGGQRGGLKGALAGALPAVMSMLSTGLIKAWKEGTEKGTKASQAPIKDLASDTESIFKTTSSKIGDFFGDMFNSLGTGLGKLWDIVGDMLNSIGSWLSKLFGGDNIDISGGTSTGPSGGMGGILDSLSSIFKSGGAGEIVPQSSIGTGPYNPKGIYWSGGSAVSGADLNANMPFANMPSTDSLFDFDSVLKDFPDSLVTSFNSAVPEMSASFGEGMTDVLPGFFDSFGSGMGSITSMFGNTMGSMFQGLFSMGGGGMGGGMMGGMGMGGGGLLGMLPGFSSMGGAGMSTSGFGAGIDPFSGGMGAGLGGGMGGGGMGGMGMMGMGILGSMIQMGGRMSGNQGARMGTGIAGGALQGASMGMMAGPWGALAGGIIGAIMGGLSSRKREKGGYIPDLGMAGIISRPTSVLSFEEGGIAPSMGMAGVVKEPTLVHMGEKAPSQFEAVVPLPDNKSIPVSFRGGGMGEAMDSKHNINLQLHLVTPVVDPIAFQPTPQQIVQHVKADYDGDGELRTTIREDLNRG